MTINCTAPIALAFYVCVAEKQGVPRAELRGTIQTDILKEYIAQKEWIFPARAVDAPRDGHDRVLLCGDAGGPISISGYHIREAGSNAVQELAFTLMNGFTYVEAAIERGLDVDDPRRGSRSSSTPTSTSSRRSPSTGRRGGSGRASCASATAPRARARG